MSARGELIRIQRMVWDLITSPEGVEKAAADLQQKGRLESTDLSFLVRGDERLGPRERLDIYADMYFYRLRDCLAEDFPKVAAVTGGKPFHNLVTDYLLSHPSSSWTLRNLGEPFPGFIGGHEVGGKYPYLADLAGLEWARIDVFDEQDTVPLERSALTGLEGDRIESRSLRLAPACRLLELDWSVAPVWRQVEDLESGRQRGGTNSAAVDGAVCVLSRQPMALEPPEQGRTYIRVWRKGFSVLHRTITGEEHACLREIRDGGATLPRLCEVALESLASSRPVEDRASLSTEATQHMAELLETWLTDRLLRS